MPEAATIPVTTKLKPSVHKLLITLATIQNCSDSDLIAAIVENAVKWKGLPNEELQLRAFQLRNSGMTWKGIGEKLGVSLQRARQLAITWDNKHDKVLKIRYTMR